MYTHAVHNATEYTGMTGLQAGRLQPSLRSVERTCPEWKRPHRAKGAIGFSLSSRASIPPRCRMSRQKVRSFSSFTLPTVGQQWDSKRCVTTGQLFVGAACPRIVLPFGLRFRRARRMPARCVGLAAFTHATKARKCDALQSVITAYTSDWPEIATDTLHRADLAKARPPPKSS
jgi:hypothetical protein